MELLGRERARTATRALIAECVAGRGGALVLRGEAGVGLSALLDDAVTSASGVRTVRVTGSVAERDLQLAAIHQIATSLPAEMHSLAPAHGELLESAFAGAGDADTFALGQALLALLRAAADETPLVWTIDDMQWLDRASAAVVAFAVRRLERERVAVIGAIHGDRDVAAAVDGVAEVDVPPLSPEAARKLLEETASELLDADVRDRLVAEAAGFPLALVNLPRELTPAQLAGAAGLPDVLPAGRRIRERLLAPFGDLPVQTRRLLVLVAVEPASEATLLWRAAAAVGIGPEAAAPAEDLGLLRIGRRVAFRHPLMRLAIHEVASVAARKEAHEAFVTVLDESIDPDAHVWHRAAASLVPDDEIAAAMEASAMRARSRHDKRAAATRFERAAELTVEPALRNARVLAAAQAALAAGALGRAVALLDSTRPENFDELQRAEAARLRGMIGLARGQGTDRIRMLLGAARAFETLDRDLARDSYLEAIEAALELGRIGRGLGLREIAEAARARARSDESRARPADMLLDGLVLLITAGHGVAAPALRAAINAIRDSDDSRWLALAAVAALEIWDNDVLHDLAAKIEIAHGTDASLSPSGLEWITGLDDVLAGRLAKTLTRTEREAADPVDVLAAAWRGQSTEARELAETCMRESFARDRGLRVSSVHYALTLLDTGLGRYEAALSAARDACEEPGLWIVTATLPELIEAAARSGEREVAAVALGTLSDRAIPAGSHWALGLLARSRALLAEGADADRLFADAIEHLRRSRIAPELARAHLLYGEWLRRERRRREAREELRTARDMFVFIGAQAFATRARRELAATGEHIVARPEGAVGSDVVVEELLTPQELRIAYLARDGVSNADIAAELYISARTVEYHLHKVFRKLEVASRTQLARVLPEIAHET